MVLEILGEVALAVDDRRLDLVPSTKLEAQYAIQGAITYQAYHRIFESEIAMVAFSCSSRLGKRHPETRGRSPSLHRDSEATDVILGNAHKTNGSRSLWRSAQVVKKGQVRNNNLDLESELRSSIKCTKKGRRKCPDVFARSVDQPNSL